MLTTTQKDTAHAIVNLFETGTVLGDYGQVTVLDGDTVRHVKAYQAARGLPPTGVAEPALIVELAGW